MAHRGRKNADEALLLALACGATADAAAQKAGVSVRTVARRLADPKFKARLQLVRFDMVQRTSGALTAASQEAVRTLLTLQKEATPPAVRLGAARAILEMGIKLREVAELEERLTEVEQRLSNAEGNSP